MTDKGFRLYSECETAELLGNIPKTSEDFLHKSQGGTRLEKADA
jgi:hypothetical protein